jgi:DNA-binding Xre family transcriptional regulator
MNVGASKTKAARKRLFEIDLEEVSVVDTPAIGEDFIVVKRKTDLRKSEEGSVKDTIVKLMEAKGITLDALAAGIGMPGPELQALMDGEADIPEEWLAKIAAALEVDVAELTGQPDPTEAPEEKVADAPAAAPAAPAASTASTTSAPGSTSMDSQVVKRHTAKIAEMARLLNDGPQDLASVKKGLTALSNGLYGLNPTVEVAVLSKSLDHTVDGATSLTELEPAFAVLEKLFVSARKQAGTSVVTKSVAAPKTQAAKDAQIEELKKRVQALELGGASKSTSGEDAAAKQKLEKKDTSFAWLGDRYNG